MSKLKFLNFKTTKLMNIFNFQTNNQLPKVSVNCAPFLICSMWYNFKEKFNLLVIEFCTVRLRKITKDFFLMVL